MTNENNRLFSQQIADRLGSRAVAIPLSETSRTSGSAYYGSQPKKGSKSSSVGKKSVRKSRADGSKIADSPEAIEILRTLISNAGGGIEQDKPNFFQKHIADPLYDLGTSPKQWLVRGGDLLSRPQNMVAEATRRFISDSADEGNPFTVLDDVLVGAGDGLTGQKKTSFRDVGTQALKDLEHIPNPGVFPLREYTQQLLDPNKTLAPVLQYEDKVTSGEITPTDASPLDNMTTSQQKQFQTDAAVLGYLGLAGDLVLDPTNLVGGGVIKGLRGGVEAEQGVKGLEAVRSAATTAGREALAETDAVSKIRTAALRRITDAIKAKLDETTLELSGGPNIGKVVGADRASQHSAALAGAAAKRSEMTADFDRTMSRWAQLREAGRLDEAAKKRLRREPLYKKWEEEVVSVLKSKFDAKSIPKKYLGKDGRIDPSKINRDDIFAEAAARVRSSFDSDTKNFYELMASKLQDRLVKRPGIKLGDRRITIGSKKAWAKVNNATDWARDSSLGRAFSFERNFPGVSGAIASGAKTAGVRWADDIAQEFLQTIGHVTKGEDELIQKALLTGQKLTGETGKKLDAIKLYYQQMWDLQKAAGLEVADKAPNDAYAFSYFSGRSDAVDKARKLRKKLLETGDPDWFAKFERSSEAKHVRQLSKSARQNFIFHTNDVMRQIVRQEMRNRMIKTYGVKIADLSDEALQAMPITDLQSIKNFKFTPDLLEELAIADKAVGKGKHKWYIDNEAAEILDRFETWAKNGQNPEASAILRGIDRLTRFIKTSNTVPFPPYHIRNMITDYITGSMDGVKFADWESVAGLEAKLRGIGPLKADPAVVVRLGSEEVPYSRLREAYDSTAGSVGFYRTEIPFSGSSTRAKVAGVGEKLKGTSQAREDWGRIAHFKSAMAEEYPAALKRYKTESEAWNAATQSAAYRVNKYHADYGALTNFENTYAKRAIPFYTYSRRMIPVMMEAMLMNPSYFTVGNKLQQLQSGILGEERPPDWHTRPEWMNEIGWTNFPGSDWGIAPGNLLPQGTIQQWFGEDIQDSTQKVVASGNPLLRLLGDVAYEKDAFTGEEGRSIPETALNLLRPYTTGQRVLNPGSNSGLEQILRTGLGLPAYELNDARKESAAWENKAEVQKGMDQLDSQLREKGYGIYVSGDPQIIKVVRRNSSGDPVEVLYEGDDMKRAATQIASILNG